MMKKLLIIYNVVFLLAGNVLLATNHYFQYHDHDHSHAHNTDQCEECIIIENNSNYVSEFQEVNFSTINTNLFVSKYILIEFNIEQTYLSRAPPIS